MILRLFLLCWFCIGSFCWSFGQQTSDSLKLRKNYIFYNLTSIVGYEGSSLQFGYNYQFKPFIDLQLEVGFLSDDLIDARFPYEDYVGFRIRPQIKFLDKGSLFNEARFYYGVLLSYQHLTYRENKNFEIDNNFFQNITYQGTDKSYAWYLVGGLDGKLASWLQVSLSVGIGQVFTESKVIEGDIPENAILLSDCIWFCGRNGSIDSNYNRPVALLEFKIGYLF